MPLWTVILLAILGWVAAVVAVRLLIVPLRRCAPEGDIVEGLLLTGSRLYARLFHRVRYRGQEELRWKVHPGPLVIVSNHTSSIDPLLIQCGCCFHIRWLMAADMMTPTLDWLWKQQEVIPVQRGRTDSAPVRESIRHLRAGGVLGIFPEGRITQPRGAIGPFLEGAGRIVAHTGAPVLLVWVSGTPDTEALSEAFFRFSRSRVEFVSVLDFTGEKDSAAITRAMREKLAEASGWPLKE